MENTPVIPDYYHRMEMRPVVSLTIAKYLMSHLQAEAEIDTDDQTSFSFSFELSDFTLKYKPLIQDLIRAHDKSNLGIEVRHVVNQIVDDSIMPWQIRYLLLAAPKLDIIATYQYGILHHGNNIWNGKIYYEEDKATNTIVKHCRARVFRY